VGDDAREIESRKAKVENGIAEKVEQNASPARTVSGLPNDVAAT
jgi:hypothetical protein